MMLAALTVTLTAAIALVPLGAPNSHQGRLLTGLSANDI